jgi:hypothetical protein
MSRGSQTPMNISRTKTTSSPVKLHNENIAIADKLRDYADLLIAQGADGFRVRAYRRGADAVAHLAQPVSEILARKGRDGLVALPKIGAGIAGVIAQIVATGRWSQLERVRGELAPEKLFRTIPGIGPRLARRLAEDGQLETLEDVENALQHGELVNKGFGKRRQAMLATLLAERLGRSVFARRVEKVPPPPLSLLLEVDSIYRQKAAAGQLRLIAPKRFNPSKEAWLPILHASHGKWHFTALYSNTLLAHKLGKTRDWVIINFQAEGQPEGRCTVVTETSGQWCGKRVVRGREEEQNMEKEPDEAKSNWH